MKDSKAITEEFLRLYNELDEEQKRLVVDYIIKDYEGRYSKKDSEMNMQV